MDSLVSRRHRRPKPKRFRRNGSTVDITSPNNPILRYLFGTETVKDSDSSPCQSNNPEPKRLKILACNAQFSKGNTLLHQFVLNNSDPNDSGSENYISAVLLSMSDVPANVINALNEDGYSALHLAVLNKNHFMVKKLLFCLVNIDFDAKCYVDRENDPYSTNICYRRHSFKADTALHMAAELGHLSIAQELLNKGVNTEVINAEDETALCVAVKSQHLDVIELLVSRGAEVNYEGVWSTPLCNAALSKNFEIVKFLVSKGANVNGPIFTYNKTPLHCAAYSGSLEIAEFLVRCGAYINAECQNLETPLLVAVALEHLEIFRFLIGEGADWNTIEGSGKTVLHYAAYGNSLEVASFLIDQGADINAVDENGKTPLHCAVSCYRINLGLVHFLVRKGANVRAKDKNGKTPLHFNVNEKDVAFLIGQGADVHATDVNGRTPLHAAAYGGRAGVIKVLVAKGADVKAKDKDGKTPLHLAREKKNQSCIDILQNVR